MKKLMILGASELQLPAIKKAKSLGLLTIVLDMDDNAIGKSFADKFYQVSTLDEDKVIEVAKSEKIDGILTICSDRPMPIIARVGEALKLNTISYDCALKSTNKAMMRKTLKKAKVAVPKFYICDSYEAYKNSILNFKDKYIVKPSDNSGSRGIYFVEKRKNVNDIDTAYEFSVSNSANGIVLVEEFMEGPEVSVEIIVVNNKPCVLQITDKITTGAPHFVEMGHFQPSQLSSEQQQKISSLAVNAVIALGIDKGAAHVEIKLTKTGPKIVEVGARLGGDHITTDLVPLSTGVDMVELAINSALGNGLKINKGNDNSSFILYFNTNTVKCLKDIESLISRYKIDAKVEQLVMLNDNTLKKEIVSSNDRSGYIICSSKKIDQSLKLFSEIYNIINKKKYLVFVENSDKKQIINDGIVKLSTVNKPSYLAAKKLGYSFILGINSKSITNVKCEQSDVILYNQNCYRNPLNFLEVASAYSNLKEVVKSYAVDTIHCNTPIGGIVGRLVGKKFGINHVIYTAHGFHFFNGGNKIKNFIFYAIESWFAHYTDAIITMNEEDYLAAKQFTLRNNGRVYKVNGVGVDIKWIKEIQKNISKSEIRKKLNLSVNDIAIISIGDLISRKNYEFTIDAISKLKNKSVKFFICGDGPLKKALEDKVKKLCLENQVFFLGYRKDVLELFVGMDIFLLSSFQEGLPRVVMEAMASAKPCVVSKIRGNVDLVDTNGGYVFDPYNLQELIDSLNILINSPILCEKMGLYNSNVIKEYDIQVVEKQIFDILKKEIGNCES